MSKKNKSPKSASAETPTNSTSHTVSFNLSKSDFEKASIEKLNDIGWGYESKHLESGEVHTVKGSVQCDFENDVYPGLSESEKIILSKSSYIINLQSTKRREVRLLLGITTGSAATRAADAAYNESARKLVAKGTFPSMEEAIEFLKS